MSTLSVTTINTANGTTDLTVTSGNTVGGKVIVSSGGGVFLQGNSGANAIVIATNNAVTFSNTVNITGATTFSNTVNITGAATFSNTVNITGDTTVAGNFSMASSFKRNHLINGNMLFAQRGTSGALQNNSSIYPSIDRFVAYYSAAGGAGTFSQVASGLTGFQYAAKLQRASGNMVTSAYALGQACETLNSVDLQGKSITLSFYAKAGANLSQPIGINIYTGTGTDQSFSNMTGGAWTGESTIVSTSTSITTGWVLYAYTGAVSSTATQIGFQVSWNASGTAGADESLYITGVQLEVGTKANPYELQIYSDQLVQCQRYYVQESGIFFARFFQSVASFGYPSLYLPVTMRTAPTVTIPAYTNAGTASGSPSAAIITSRQITFAQTPSGSGEGNISNVTYTASAEL